MAIMYEFSINVPYKNASTSTFFQAINLHQIFNSILTCVSDDVCSLYRHS